MNFHREKYGHSCFLQKLVDNLVLDGPGVAGPLEFGCTMSLSSGNYGLDEGCFSVTVGLAIKITLGSHLFFQFIILSGYFGMVSQIITQEQIPPPEITR